MKIDYVSLQAAMIVALVACSTPALEAMEQRHDVSDINASIGDETGDKGIAYGAYSRGDYEKAFVEFQKLANSGDLYSQYNLGHMYEKGLGTKQDIKMAVRWYELASQSGFAAASFNLGLIYDKGEGIDKDSSRAAAYYKYAADNGHVKASTNLAYMYLNGTGVPKDIKAAFTLFKNSAYRDDELAQVELGVLYGNGIGTKKDIKEAYAWFAIAVMKNAPHAKDNFEMASRALTPIDLSIARKRVEEIRIIIDTATQ